MSNYCVDCKWVYNGYAVNRPRCLNPKFLSGAINGVTGEPVDWYTICEYNRMTGSFCPKGSNFEPKPVTLFGKLKSLFNVQSKST